MSGMHGPTGRDLTRSHITMAARRGGFLGQALISQAVTNILDKINGMALVEAAALCVKLHIWLMENKAKAKEHL